MKNGYTVSVIVPAKNEAETIVSLLDAIPDWVDEIIVVDGQSGDETFNLSASHPRVSVTVQQRSKGKGAALSAGFARATCDLVAIIDADGSMNPQELGSYIAVFPGCDIAKGSRYIQGGGSSDLTFIRSIGNRALTRIANILFKQHWTDMAYGYAVFERKLLSSLALTNYDGLGSIGTRKAYGQGFEIETLMFTRAARRGLEIKEIPSYETSRIAGASNLRAVRDGFRVLFSLLIERARSVPLPNVESSRKNQSEK